MHNCDYDVSFICCDISEENQIIRIMEEINRVGRVDVLFNNAGIMLNSHKINEYITCEWDDTFNNNCRGTFLFTKYLVNFMTSGGCIINNASIAGMHSYISGQSYAYSASKAAIIQFTRQLSINLASQGIRVNSISPGIVNVPIDGGISV